MVSATLACPRYVDKASMCWVIASRPSGHACNARTANVWRRECGVGRARGVSGKPMACAAVRKATSTSWSKSGLRRSDTKRCGSAGAYARRRCRYRSSPARAVSCRGTRRLFLNFEHRITRPSGVRSSSRRWMASDARSPVDASSGEEGAVGLAPQGPVPRARGRQDQLSNLVGCQDVWRRTGPLLGPEHRRRDLVTPVFGSEVARESDHVPQSPRALRERPREPRPLDCQGRADQHGAPCLRNAAKLSSCRASERNTKPVARRTATYEATATVSMTPPPATAARSGPTWSHRPWRRSPLW